MNSPASIIVICITRAAGQLEMLTSPRSSGIYYRASLDSVACSKILQGTEAGKEPENGNTIMDST